MLHSLLNRRGRGRLRAGLLQGMECESNRGRGWLRFGTGAGVWVWVWGWVGLLQRAGAGGWSKPGPLERRSGPLEIGLGWNDAGPLAVR